MKQFAKKEKELETLKQTVKIFSKGLELEFGIEKCTMLMVKNRKRQMTERIELTNQEKIRTPEENQSYKILGKLEADTIKHADMKEKHFLKKSISVKQENYSNQTT